MKKALATIRIVDLKLKAVIGVNDWETKTVQDVRINIMVLYNAQRAIATDRLKFALDYKALKLSVIRLVKNSSFQLLESLTAAILELIMRDPRIMEATVRVDKPKALRFARSVCVEMTQSRIRGS